MAGVGVFAEVEQRADDGVELDEPKLGNVSYHVRALLDDGLVELVRTEQRRGALAHFYRASPKLLA